MRPLRLSMQAFGPFATEEVIDFAALGDVSLFLIHGPTGSGKTTVLDAICFALFGQTSGDERDGAQMRSQHAAADTLTEVTFDFRFRGEVYRVRRSPTQERPKKRGGGTTTEQHAASLWREPTADSDGEALETKPRDVNARVEGLLGLTAQQFRQVVVLPQGRFREVLSADSGAREQIFQQLFQTQLYRDVTDQLKGRAATLGRELRDARLRHTTRLEAFAVEDLVGLGELVKRQAAAAEQAKSDEAVAKAARSQARAAHQHGQEAQKKLDEQAEAEAERAEVLSEAPQAKLTEERLRDARGVEPLVAWRETCAQQRRDATGASERLAKAERAANEAAAAKQAAERALKAERARDGEREEAAKRVMQLEGYVEPQARLLTAEREQVQAGQALRRVEKAEADARVECGRREEAATRAREAVELNGERASKLEGLEARVERSRRREKAAAELAAEERALTAAREKLARAAAQEAEAQQEHRARKREHDELETRWRGAQAARLAKELAAGEPCPVCGGTEHPHPAESVDDMVGDGQLEQARAARDAAQLRVVEAAGALAAGRKEAEGQGRRVEEARARLEELPAMEETEDIAALEASLLEARRAREQRDSLADAERAAKAAADEARAATERCASEAVEARLSLGQVEERVATLRREVPEELRSERALSEAREQAEATRAALVKALSEADAKQRVTAEAASRAEAELQAARTDRENKRAQLALAESELLRRREEAGFEDAERFERALADVASIAALEREVSNHKGRLQAAEERLARAQEQAKGLASPDLAALAAAASEAEDAHQRAVEQLTEARNVARASREALESLSKEAEATAQLEQAQRRVSHLADVAQGRGGNALNLSFQRYVLTVLLDEVLDAATRRLHVMSRGRYELRRVEGVTHGGRASGLELEVFDGYTGQVRPVSTLSGGEGFLAALALSLGLVDVVQSYAGGIELDALFIDEGFGSLDEQSLRDAIDVLTQLNQQAKRLVGIISHVPELRSRIDARLEVRPAEVGSETQLSVP